MRRATLIGALVWLIVVCFSDAAPKEKRQQCRDLEVMVEVQGVDCRPTVPSRAFDVVVRARSGKVLGSGKTAANGRATIRVCWIDGDPPARVEATFREGDYLEGLIRGYDGRQQGICFLLSLIHRSDCE